MNDAGAASLLAGLVSLCLVRGVAVQRNEAGAAPRHWADRWGGRLGRWWAAQLHDAGVEGEPRQWARVAVATIGLAVGVGLLRAGPSGALAALGIAVVASVLARRVTRGRGDRLADHALPELLEHTGRHLRNGRDLPTALRAASAAVTGAHAAELRVATERVDGGADLRTTLLAWEERHPRPAVGLAVGALSVAAATGGAAARALDAVAANLRDRNTVADEARALASQAKASAAVLITLPLVVVIAGSAADGGVAASLLSTPLGLACLAAATGLDAIGAWWMHRIVAEAR